MTSNDGAQVQNGIAAAARHIHFEILHEAKVPHHSIPGKALVVCRVKAVVLTVQRVSKMICIEQNVNYENFEDLNFALKRENVNSLSELFLLNTSS